MSFNLRAKCKRYSNKGRRYIPLSRSHVKTSRRAINLHLVAGFRDCQLLSHSLALRLEHFKIQLTVLTEKRRCFGEITKLNVNLYCVLHNTAFLLYVKLVM